MPLINAKDNKADSWGLYRDFIINSLRLNPVTHGRFYRIFPMQQSGIQHREYCPNVKVHGYTLLYYIIAIVLLTSRLNGLFHFLREPA